MNKEPVYPKQDPEYRKRIMEQFYKRIRETNWETEECSRKGRQRKNSYEGRAKAQPRQGEKYNWLD